MDLAISVAAAWSLATALFTLAMLRRIDRKAPSVEWAGGRQLLILVPVAGLVLVVLYMMISGAAEGRLALPGKSSPTQYFYVSQQPVAFWLLLAFEFLLTVATAAFLGAIIFLALRSSRPRA